MAICPVMSTGLPIREHQECLHDKCSWWRPTSVDHPEEGECAAVTIARHMPVISEDLINITRVIAQKE